MHDRTYQNGYDGAYASEKDDDKQCHSCHQHDSGCHCKGHHDDCSCRGCQATSCHSCNCCHQDRCCKGCHDSACKHHCHQCRCVCCHRHSCRRFICDDDFRLRLGGLQDGLNFRLRQLIGCKVEIQLEDDQVIRGKICHVGQILLN